MKIQKMINYRIRSIRMLFVILMTLAASAQMAHAAKGGRSDFYQKYMSRPSEELIRIGKDYRLRKNKPDSALLFFTIVAGRYTPNMSAEEKREVVDTEHELLHLQLHLPQLSQGLREPAPRPHHLERTGRDECRTLLQPRIHVPAWAGQGRQWKLYSKALDCYRKGVRLALAKKDMTTADMAFTNMTTLADVVGEFANTKKEWDLYRKAHTKRNTEHYKYNITLYEGTRLKIAGQLQKAAEAYGRLIDIVPDTERNCRRRALAFVEAAEVQRLLHHFDQGLALVAEAEKLYVKYKIGDGMQSVYQTYAIFYEDMGRKADYDRSMYRYYQINDSLKAYSLPSNVFNMGLNEKVIELNQEMDGMKERQTQHRIWLIVAVLTTLFFVIILLVVMRENRELRRRNLALYHRSLEVLKSDEMAGKQRKTVSAPAVEENNATTASSKYHHSTLSDADKDRIAQLVQQVMEQTEVIIQPDFTVEKLAQNISTGQKYVSQVINETFECNFNTLLGRYRIREACRRFNDPQRYGSYTIESIARDLGFKSRSNFATTFKKHTGLNPSEHLRLAKEKNGL
jgi:putative phenazine biosynthesis phzC/phzF protein